ncbi:MAG: thiamine phosphate synthase [Nitrospiraceae bacterium]|nr:thiamine phosphate synthase [Nitrospiraceae bacterium]
MSRPFLGGVCFITGRHPKHSPVEQAVMAMKGGIRWVQLRMKDSSRKEVYRAALFLKEAADSFGAVLVINDYPDIALACGAGGVHLGQDDLPIEAVRPLVGGEMLIGVSTHSEAEARAASEAGAGYIGFGPVFDTATKDAGPPKGAAALAGIKKISRVPVTAIGGITAASIPGVLEAGADAVAISGALLAGDPFENSRQIVRLIEMWYGSGL